MTAPTFHRAILLLCGAILAPGKRTVASALRVLGRAKEAGFTNYHRVLNRAPWSGMWASRLLFCLLVALFVAAGAPLFVVVDETLDRRSGAQIRYKSRCRDPLRSSGKKVVLTNGIRWCCLCLLVWVPWSKRPWALPFLSVPVLSEKTCKKLKKKHHSSVEWAMEAVRKVRQWCPEREVIFLGDGGYAAVDLAKCCQDRQSALVSRLRMDACLYDFAPQVKEELAHRRGPKPTKGARQKSLKERLEQEELSFEKVTVCWYGAEPRLVEIASETCLWHRQGHPPVPIRWVVVRDPQEPEQESSGKEPSGKEPSGKAGAKKPRPAVCYFSSDPSIPAERIVQWYIYRWNIEVTFEEVRAHLGWGTQRHWSTKAIGRVTPCLLGLFSLVVALCKQLHPEKLPRNECSWYQKEEASFADALAAVRAHLWEHWRDTSCRQAVGCKEAGQNYPHSSPHTEDGLFAPPLFTVLREIACYAC